MYQEPKALVASPPPIGYLPGGTIARLNLTLCPSYLCERRLGLAFHDIVIIPIIGSEIN